MSDLGTIRTLLRNSLAAVGEKGVTVAGSQLQTLPAKIAEISTGSPTLPDLVAGGTYHKQNGTPVVITPISGETTAMRLLVAATGPMKTGLILQFTGAVTIDWGDGTTSSPTNNVAIGHSYDNVNPIPCGRSYGVYYVTITGGSVTYIASASDEALWGGRVGNILCVALKSTALTSAVSILRNVSIASNCCECLYLNTPNATSYNFIFHEIFSLMHLTFIGGTATFQTLASSARTTIAALDMRNIKINGDFSLPNFFAYTTSILFNPANTELGNINIQYNSLSVAGFVALFNSLPTVTAKTLQIGGSAAALALTAEQIAVATAKGWTVTRSY